MSPRSGTGVPPLGCSYGDDSLSPEEWELIYPCPVTGCWLLAETNAEADATWCRQTDCCNPEHRTER